MNLALWMYVISILSEVEIISSIIIWVTIFIFVITVLLFLFTEGDCIDGFSEGLVKYIKKFLLFVLLPAVVLVTILPNKNEMYIMTGLHFGEKILTTKKGNELLDKSYEALLRNIENSNKEDKREEK